MCVCGGVHVTVGQSDDVSYALQVCGTAFLAAARIKLCWMAPTHSSSIADMPRHTQFLLVQLGEGGGYAIILPLLPNNCKATLQPARWEASITLAQYAWRSTYLYVGSVIGEASGGLCCYAEYICSSSRRVGAAATLCSRQLLHMECHPQ